MKKKAKTYETIQTWYFYVEVESGEVVKTKKTYVIGQGQFKQPRRTKFYKTMHRMLDTLGNGVISCGYALTPPSGCVYAWPPQNIIGCLWCYLTDSEELNGLYPKMG